jgi:hypothetical protein
MKYIESPNDYCYRSQGLATSIFLAGSITNAKDWQKTVYASIRNANGVVYNPRRENFDINNPKDSRIQIEWEFEYLRKADIIVFYFSHETVAPITLFELGAALERNSHEDIRNQQKILIYCEPEYSRKSDVKIQTELIIRKFYGDEADYPTKKFATVYDDYDTFIHSLLGFIIAGE